jgi:hypothetical protein
MVRLTVGPLRWSMLPNSVRRMLLDGAKNVAQVRSQICDSAPVHWMPPVEILDEIWICSKGTIHGKAAPIDADNRLELHRTKTGNPVYLLLRPEVADELRNIPPGPDAHPDYFFWSGKGKKNKAASTWQKAFRKLWDMVTPPLMLKDRDGNLCPT